ncbi:hypothetical protein D8666_07835 [Ochrobactrum soli]|nr:hypothetical protein D8666_07835 [[Ochrobactrum] soli]
MLAFAMMAVIRYRANDATPQKDGGCRLSRFDLVVCSRNSTHRKQTCPTTYKPGIRHRMVLLAQGPPSHNKTGSSKIKNATVMLGRVSI